MSTASAQPSPRNSQAGLQAWIGGSAGAPARCETCGHSAIQHPDGGQCLYHPRAEDRCDCYGFAARAATVVPRV